jgi:hypothetical protein
MIMGISDISFFVRIARLRGARNPHAPQCCAVFCATRASHIIPKG